MAEDDSPRKYTLITSHFICYSNLLLIKLFARKGKKIKTLQYLFPASTKQYQVNHSLKKQET